MMSRVCFSPLALSAARSSARPASRWLAPFRIVDREGALLALRRRQHCEERIGRLAHRLGRHAGRPNGKEPRLNLSAGCNSLERLGEALLFGGRRHLPEAVGRAALRLSRRLPERRDTKQEHEAAEDQQAG
jgi:hypothetical protein